MADGKPGRRPKPKNEKQSKRMNLCLTIGEHKQLVADAKIAGKSASSYLRDLWLAHRGGGQ